MTAPCITLRIEGDFVDSFIYSGTLFAVTANAEIKTYDWAEIVDAALDECQDDNSNLRDFLIDCRIGFGLGDVVKEYYVDSALLNAAAVSTINLAGWPTDISLYANRFFIADEKGVSEIKYNWQTRRLDPETKFKVWNGYAYKVSANDNHRLAIAAGGRGVIAAFPRGGYIDERKDISTIVEEDSVDCEWIGSYLTSNSSSGSFVSTFAELPKPPSGPIPQTFWKRVNDLKYAIPDTGRHLIEGANAKYTWVAGRKLFSVLPDGLLVVQHVALGSDAGDFNEITASRTLHDSAVANKIISGRSGWFGTVIETSDGLYSITEDLTECLATRPVAWRVFPRAKSYVNHLHIVESDHLCIRAYIGVSANTTIDQFGVSVDEAE